MSNIINTNKELNYFTYNKISKLFLNLPDIPAILDKTYSQSYEDVIIDGILKIIDYDKYQKNEITYVDCGANHPVSTSNTFFFYEKGLQGILVEPNNDLINEIEKVRTRDKIFKGVVSDKRVKTLEFFLARDSEISSLSETYIKKWYKINSEEKVSSVFVNNYHINEVLEAVDKEKIWFLSCDIEGEDGNVIKAIDFNKFNPHIIIYEHKDDFFGEIYQFLSKKKYKLCNITRVNSIFVLQDLF